MAVQAQYPSNVLLLNRNGQEMKNNTLGNDYSLQAQTGGLVLDQSHIFFNNNNGGLNPRKRGRETGSSFGVGGNGGSTASTTTTTNLPINLFSLQPQHPQPTLINLSQLHNQQQHNMVSTGLRLAFGEQQQQQQQQQNQTHLHSSILSEDVHTQIKQQRDEIDHFLQLQGEHLRRTLAERRQTHYRALLSVAEETAIKRLREKEDEVEKAIRRNNELEQRVAQMRIEAHAWANKARNQETVAASFQAQLHHVMQAQAQAQAQAQFDNNNNKREEGVGCSGGEADDAESAHVDPERVLSSGPSCKACRKRVASVVLLPCRHLCLCTKCNADVDTCPICLSIRSASVEVYLS